ncbi:hypothetical protein K2173_027781 [Erythroxylum novogranatense]|uniref:DUF547 domain-containing protein n=1 Tax=Erythroxylum novogranatense TaxID=1862640 RepID=A0AAV8U395_9ROSI|nr:hypothetical protein K2173_027781 [Erythroxylum novogranatense]
MVVTHEYKHNRMSASDNISSSSSSSSHSLPFQTSPSSFPVAGMINGFTLLGNVTSKPSSQSISIVKLEEDSSCEASLSWDSGNKVGSSTIISIPSDETPTPKPSAEIRKEIAILEAEILHLERHLLSLYRAAFEEKLPSLPYIDNNHLQHKVGSPFQVTSNRRNQDIKSCARISCSIHVDQTFPPQVRPTLDKQSCPATVHSKRTKDQKNADSGHRSLADHLGASCLFNSLMTPDRLSEDIVRCISSIYCRLDNHQYRQIGLSASPLSSLSSSSIFSSKNPQDCWSPHCNEDAIDCQLQGLKERNGPYAGMVEIVNLCLDNDALIYAATALKSFRSMVQSLEKVDPRKMRREGKLAFWINIHNALVMHAYLAYGNRNHVRNASILKAAYNVGGHCINACTIQNSILGVRSHYSQRWLQALFSPGRKLRNGNIKHVYALEYPEPLVHFALCSGAYSDPPVRVYSSKNIFEELRLAKEEFIQARVYIQNQKEVKIFLPKLLSYFQKDMSMDSMELLELLSRHHEEQQCKALRRYIAREKPEKCINWLPQASSFRYLIHVQNEFVR